MKDAKNPMQKYYDTLRGATNRPYITVILFIMKSLGAN